ncbi:MAG: tRNA uridine(34) 5-carboxymethylaminomethyl modification radical SAM/GNAT enzyme Elp3 [Candidatus Diapherotrites archaeon]|nr:tRNA uridine(34) 5-carboxymethylaminomethyl modification radical SAM/GNAT enzyme Elp3 [Candidatus Diapherotrites archaeon]
MVFKKGGLARRTEFALRMIEEINSGKINSQKDLSARKFFWSEKSHLDEMPSNPFVLSFAKKPSKKVLSLLSIKPTRTLSGVQVIAVMMPPFPCPGKCIYCPSAFAGKKAPQSYTGFEPSALRAQRLNYDPYKIVSNRILQLDATGNFAEKIELIFQGSSFTALPRRKQVSILKKSIDAVTEKKSENLSAALLNAEHSKRRIIGITFETRPDLCGKKEISEMLSLGGTRVELGVQNPDNEIYEAINRGHSVEDVVESTRLLKDSAFKILYHLMPGLPGSDYKKDLKNFRNIFHDARFKPDMVKFYPCLVMEGTKLYDEWLKGNFFPIEEKKAVRMLARIKSELPKWVRVMRVNRDIPSNVISAGIKKTNLRQLVREELRFGGKKCACIRCREAGLKLYDEKIGAGEFSKAKLMSEFYQASGGEEAFVSFESKDALFGFLRLRKPFEPFRKEIDSKTALVRELHVYGKALPLGKRSGESTQHQGIGKLLMGEAERIAKEKFDSNKIVVISGPGVKEYYRKNFSYKKKGPYMSKAIK